MIRVAGKSDPNQAKENPMGENIKQLAKLKPVRDALNDLFALRHEMSILQAHGQAASPDRVLRLTAKLDAIGRRLSAAA